MNEDEDFFEDEDEGDEDCRGEVADDPDEDELDDFDDEEDGYADSLAEAVDCCLMCSGEAERSDRWNFDLEDEDGRSEPAWICRECHGKFESVDDFEKFRSKVVYSRLYRAAARLKRLLLMGVPPVIVANTIFGVMGGILFSSDENGGSDEMRDHGMSELLNRLDKEGRKRDSSEGT